MDKLFTQLVTELSYITDKNHNYGCHVQSILIVNMIMYNLYITYDPMVLYDYKTNSYRYLQEYVQYIISGQSFHGEKNDIVYTTQKGKKIYYDLFNKF